MILSGAGRRRRRGAGEEEGERRREECAGGEACAECASRGVWTRGPGLAPGGGLLQKDNAEWERREGGGDQVRNPSRGRRKESPLGGRGWGEAQKKCTLEILGISLKAGGKEENVVWEGVCELGVFSG